MVGVEERVERRGPRLRAGVEPGVDIGLRREDHGLAVVQPREFLARGRRDDGERPQGVRGSCAAVGRRVVLTS